MKSLEKSRDQVREQIEQSNNLRTTIKDAGALVQEIQTGLGDFQSLTFEQKRAIVDKTYPPGSIESFPKCYLASDNAHTQNLMLFQDEWWKRVKPSSIEMKKGLLICFAVIDFDF